MAQEQRTVTIVDWPAAESPGATPPELRTPRYTDINSWQDNGVRGYNLNKSTQFGGWKGCLWQYAQKTPIADGASVVITYANAFRTYLADRNLDMRDRILLTECWTEDNTVELPQGGSYDADTFQLAPVWNLWYTHAGATPNAPPAAPTGYYWTPWANVYIYSAADGSGLEIRNQSGGTIRIVISTWIFEQDDGTGNGEPEEKSVWTQNLYQRPMAAGWNSLQDRYVLGDELANTTLGAATALEGAALYYGQFTFDGVAPVLTQLDDSRDWRNRPMHSYFVAFNNLTDLPPYIAYDPDAGVNKEWNIWYTGAGADPANPAPVAETSWNPRANHYIFAARLAVAPLAVGDLGIRNASGADTYGMLLTFQHPVGS